MDVSNIEARPTLRLYTLWLEQQLAGDALSLRIGQLAADDEFITSDTAGNLINGTFGWPLLTSGNMTDGGPAYPLPTPGIRVQAKPLPGVTLLGAVFSGNMSGQGCTAGPQICNPSGTTFSFSGGTLWMGELQYTPPEGQTVLGLPGTYKIGGWRETGNFVDQATGAFNHSGDWGIYGVIDQALWRPPGSENGLNMFVRTGLTPDDRNLVSWYIDGGLGYTGIIPGRPDDVLTIGAAYGHISDDAARADRAAGPPTPERDHEAVIELDYKVAVTPWCTLQPDLQYVIHPGGNVANPSGVGTVADALVLGARMRLVF
jgi:porin